MPPTIGGELDSQGLASRCSRGHEDGGGGAAPGWSDTAGRRSDWESGRRRRRRTGRAHSPRCRPRTSGRRRTAADRQMKWSGGRTGARVATRACHTWRTDRGQRTPQRRTSHRSWVAGPVAQTVDGRKTTPRSRRETPTFLRDYSASPDRGLPQRGLEFRALRRARERDDVADVPAARDLVHRAIEAEAEAGVRHGAVAPQVALPPEDPLVEAHRLDPLVEDLQPLLALAATDASSPCPPRRIRPTATSEFRRESHARGRRATTRSCRRAWCS